MGKRKKEPGLTTRPTQWYIYRRVKGKTTSPERGGMRTQRRQSCPVLIYARDRELHTKKNNARQELKENGGEESGEQNEDIKATRRHITRDTKGAPSTDTCALVDVIDIPIIIHTQRSTRYKPNPRHFASEKLTIIHSRAHTQCC